MNLGVLGGEREIRLGDGDVDRIGGGRVVIGVSLVDRGEDVGPVGQGKAGNDESSRTLAEGCEGVEALAVGEKDDGPGRGWHAHGAGEIGGEREGLAGRRIGRARGEGHGGRELARERDDRAPVGRAGEPIAVSCVGGSEGQKARGEIIEGHHRLEIGVAGGTEGLPGGCDRVSAQGHGDIAGGERSVEGKVAGGQLNVDGQAGARGDGGGQRPDGEAGAARNHGERGGGSGGIVARVSGVGLADGMAAGREDTRGPLRHAGGVERLRGGGRRRSQGVGEGNGPGGRGGLIGNGGVGADRLRIQKDLRSVGQGDAGGKRVKIEVEGVPSPADGDESVVLRSDGDGDGLGFAGREGPVASVDRGELIGSAGQVVHLGIKAARDQGGIVDGRVMGDAVVAGEAHQTGGRAGALGGRDRALDRGGLAMNKAGRVHAERRCGGRERDRTPVVDEVGHVHRAEPGGKIVAGAGGIAVLDEEAAGVAGRGAGHAVGGAQVAEHLVAAHGDVVKDSRLPGGERVVDEVWLPLAAGLALVDECLDAGHGLGAGRGAAGAGDDDRPAAGEVGAVAGKGADGIKAVVIAICGKERNVGNVAHFIGGDAGSCLPGRLGVALRS